MTSPEKKRFFIVSARKAGNKIVIQRHKVIQLELCFYWIYQWRKFENYSSPTKAEQFSNFSKQNCQYFLCLYWCTHYIFNQVNVVLLFSKSHFMKWNDGTDDIADDDAICKINKKKNRSPPRNVKKSPFKLKHVFFIKGPQHFVEGTDWVSPGWGVSSGPKRTEEQNETRGSKKLTTTTF